VDAGSFPRGRRGAWALATGVVALIGIASSAPSTPRGDGGRGASGPAAVHPAANGPMWLEMRNVDLHIDETQAIGIRYLRGEVVRSDAGVPAALDDSKSFTVRVTAGTVVLSGDALEALLNEVVFAYRGSPLKHLRATIGGSQVVLRGIMHKGVDLPFEIASTPTLEADGRVRLHPSRTRILGIDGAKLMRALGLHLDKLLDLRGASGVTVAGNDLLLEPTKILPPPAIVGRLTSIAVEGDRIVQTFVRLPEDSVFDGFAHPDTAAANFINFRGGELRFGKLLMEDTDLDILDGDPGDPLDLDLAQYARQLVAGTSRTMPNQGLRVVMPDYRRVAVERGRVATRPLPHDGRSPARANLAVDSTRQSPAPGRSGCIPAPAPAITRQVANDPALTEIFHQSRQSVASRREGQPAEGGVPRSRTHGQ